MIFFSGSTHLPILEDPRATSWDNEIFSGEQYFRRKSLLQELKSPWELILTEPVPEVIEICPTDWPDNYFSKGEESSDAQKVCQTTI